MVEKSNAPSCNHRKDFVRSILIKLVLGMLVASCALGAGWPRENFIQTFDHHVGKSVDDPTTRTARYPQNITRKRNLPNGNTEIEYLHIQNAYGRYGPCYVYFEVDAETQAIVGWRYEGSKDACVIPP
jgi:hypothetical protein